MKYIPKSFINNLIKQCDLVELVGSLVELKKFNSHYIGLCPFHDEKTPSFTISVRRQLYHCFGCGLSGNALTFLMEFEVCNVEKAVEKLAEFLEVDMIYELSASNDENEIEILLLKLVNEPLTDIEKKQLQDLLSKRIGDKDV